MEYFIISEGVKQGPFDLIAMIKKVKNGSLNNDTLVAQHSEGPFIEANRFEEVAQIINEHSNPSIGRKPENLKMTLKACILEGVDLWARRVLDYTLIAGLIMALGVAIQYITRGIFSKESIIPTYFATVFIFALFCEFCHYVLETKRSQQVSYRDFLRTMQRSLPGFFGLAAVISLFILAFGINIQLGLFATFLMLIVITLLIFTPFLVTDSQMGVVRAAKLSVQKVLSVGGDNYGVILAIVSINLFAAVLPALMMKELLALGLFISIPVTMSAIAYIYDQIFV